MPDLNDNVGTVLVELHGRIVGAGILKPVPEAIMILDHSLPKVTQTRALTEIIKQGVFFSRKYHATQMHVFIEDPKFYDLMKNRYGFEEPKGRSLVLEV